MLLALAGVACQDVTVARDYQVVGMTEAMTTRVKSALRTWNSGDQVVPESRNTIEIATADDEVEYLKAPCAVATTLRIETENSERYVHVLFRARAFTEGADTSAVLLHEIGHSLQFLAEGRGVEDHAEHLGEGNIMSPGARAAVALPTDKDYEFVGTTRPVTNGFAP